MKGQEYLKAGIEIDRTELDATYRLNRNAKGMLSFPMGTYQVTSR